MSAPPAPSCPGGTPPPRTWHRGVVAEPDGRDPGAESQHGAMPVLGLGGADAGSSFRIVARGRPT